MKDAPTRLTLFDILKVGSGLGRVTAFGIGAGWRWVSRGVSLGARVIAVLVAFVLGYAIVSIPVAAWEAFGSPLGGWRYGLMVIGGLLSGAAAALRFWEQALVSGDGVHGTARWATRGEINRTLGGKDGIIVGRGSDGRLLRYGGPSHLLTIAPTRSGKGVGAIIPNLLLLERSILCVDPKGENARITAEARRRFGPVHVLDPFEVSEEPSASFNPLAALDPMSLDLAEEAAAIAEALVYDPPHQVGEAHWNEEARALITGVILHVVTSELPMRRTLVTVRELLTAAPDQLGATLKAMQRSGAAGGLVARAANRHLAKTDREAAGVLSAAQRHTHFLDSPRMARVLGRSDFAFGDLKDEVATVFLVLPPDRLATHARWLRLLIVQSVNALSRRLADRDAQPVLFLLDEFRSLGQLEAVERAFGLLAGYGVQLWPFVQDLHQLRGAYGQEAGTFLSNAGLVQVFNVADVDTASWVSRTLGSRTVRYETAGGSSTASPGQWGESHTSSSSDHLSGRPLLTADEVMGFDGGKMILLRPGARPAFVWKVRYWDDAEFRSGQSAGRGREERRNYRRG
ncbi:type IV secretory system conjugative DNA transfer family protein [Caulobacter sp. NIBR2454]|uniref:type IV secretory system conjugative DNA transfer family protein n=1 Tax=Caulobacter sp. NIBR2454 TaxID=3015996 RepID=UPI0022B73AF3|nr:type IV secretory system conjugative DNA transfer family protein [Caulobacter sp. NIBR2454]